MNEIKRIIKKFIPLRVLDYHAKLTYSKSKSKFKDSSVENVFVKIYTSKYWNYGESVSGPGSSIKQTKNIIEGINQVVAKLDISRVLDIPCGDFNWISYIDFSKIRYIGGDIVEELILKNRKKYKTDRIDFYKIDLLEDNLPSSDLLITRDCFVHFSYGHIYQSLLNIKKSDCKYLMSTTFVKHTINYDIVTGDWRPINLEIPPFDFPKPIMIIPEHIEQGFEREYKGKSLAIWKIEDLDLPQKTYV
ncbi:class I SAM-dependent methyltransferase [Aquimarina sp. RZ0]|uniref:class I SAM-dependent methyltransferase n=1 Tax=Aquimarina sp. RZ0 TaxID=2607730 RepID=UPI0011F3DE08|nr:class I SAM-dependent methyltransferase [Aquimarina sp. RZ0]KAA1244135.1 class I SAM-dependent methyltransferase [Aquimarina sp. RZ0]